MTTKDFRYKKVRCPRCGTRYLTSPDHPESCPSCSLPHSVGEITVTVAGVVKATKVAVSLWIIIFVILFFPALIIIVFVLLFRGT